MKKRVWIMNHYATRMFFEQGGRHLWMATELKKQGYEPIIFCADKVHNAKDEVPVQDGYTVKQYHSIPFVFLKTNGYSGNGFSRIRNMYDFYRGLMKNYYELALKIWKPDIILASSVHPLTLIAGIRIAKKLGIPCICEVRDLWPESIVAYGKLKRNSLITRLLYAGEKWIYKKADEVIMTIPGGQQYILDRKWEREVPLEKVHYINNGVVLQDFDRNMAEWVWQDDDLTDSRYFRVIYTGSIRPVNDLGMLLDAAKLLQERGYENVRFLIYGDGTEREMLEQRIKDEDIHNVLLKGSVEKKYIPSILKRGNVNILHNRSTELDRYGQSQNKLFEYMAAGRYIVQTAPAKFGDLEREGCGLVVETQTPEHIADAIAAVYGMAPESYEEACKKTRELAEYYDFHVLTKKLISIIEDV